MEIKIDYYLKQDGMSRIMNTTFTEADLMEYLESKFREGELPCPIHFDKERVQVDFRIDKIIS